MRHEDSATHAEIETELAATMEKAARLRRELEAIDTALARIVELFLRTTGREDLAVDFLNSLGQPRQTLH